MKTLLARDYGILPDTGEDLCQKVMRMITDAGSDCRYCFEKGRYDFYNTGSIKKYIALSNTDDTQERCLAVLFDKLNNVILDGCGCSFVFHGQILPFSAIACENVSICNLSIDWEIPLSAEGEIVAVSDSYTDMKIDPKKFPFKVKENKLFFIGEDWEMPYVGFSEFDRTTKKVAYRRGDTFESTSQEQLDATTVRFYDSSYPRPIVGNFGVLRHNKRIHPALLFDDSKNCNISNVTIHNSGGLGILAQFCENIVFDKVEFRPNTTVGRRVVSGHDDGLHLSNNRGKINVSNCYFYGLMDDPMNVHGTSAVLETVENKNKVKASFLHHQSVNFSIWAKKGDKISFVDCETLGEKAVYTVLEYRLLNKQCFELVFEEEMSLNSDIKYGLENITATPSVYCHDNFFGSCRARGILITTRKPVVVENNVFQSAGSAILLAGDCNEWYEMGACHDVTIKNNYFDACCNTSDYQFCEGVISICPTIPKKEACFHKNIVIENNTFCAFDSPVLYAFASSGISFLNNKVVVSNEYEPYHLKNLLNLVECENVTEAGNIVLGNNGFFPQNSRLNFS